MSDVKLSYLDQEARVIQELQERLACIIRGLEKQPPAKRLDEELEHAVKLCHQIRSLVPSAKLK